MARPQFSEMLVTRRRQLGLSITQASRVLRLKEQVLIAFEEGDFENMPKSGYAQGMLSSYARYLGLNSQAVVQQFSRDLYAYEQARSGRPLVADEGMPVRERRMREYQGARGLLPTSGGYAGDMTDYATTSRPRTRQQGQPAEAPRQVYGRPADGTTRRYTSRYVPLEGSTRANQQRTAREQRTRSDARARYEEGSGSARREADRVTTRRVSSSEYVDDMRYGEARPYQAASTREGRSYSRNIASTERPRVQRRDVASREQLRQRGRRQEPRHRGLRGAMESLMADQQRAMTLLVLVVVLVLTIVIIFSVQSCISAPAENASRTVAVSTDSGSGSSDSSSSSSSSDSTNSDEASKAAAEAAAAKAAQEEAEQSTETDVEVSVADGEVSWVEITCDGTSEVAEQVTGPWSKSFVVTDSITIQVDNTPAVTVTKNGSQQSFDSKTSGIGTITIQGTKASSDSASSSTDSSSDDSSDSSSDGTSSSSSSSKSSGSSSSKKTSSSSKSTSTSSKSTSSGSDTSSSSKSTSSKSTSSSSGSSN